MSATRAVSLAPGVKRPCGDCGDDAVATLDGRALCLTCLDIAEADDPAFERADLAESTAAASGRRVKKEAPVSGRKMCPSCGKDRVYHRFPKGDPEGRCLYCVARASGGRKKPAASPSVRKAPAALKDLPLAPGYIRASEPVFAVGFSGPGKVGGPSPAPSRPADVPAVPDWIAPSLYFRVLAHYFQAAGK